MNKRLKKIEIISSIIAAVSIVLALLGGFTTLIPDLVVIPSVFVILVSALICLICFIITFIQLLMHKKIQKYVKKHWKRILFNWFLLCLILGIVLTVTDGFGYSVLWCIPESLLVIFLQITVEAG